MNQKKTQNHISKKKQTSKQDNEGPQKKEPIKVAILSSQNDLIPNKFLQEIEAEKKFSQSFKSTVGVEFYTKCLSAKIDYRIHFWSVENAPHFESLLPIYLKSSWGIIYFYGITDAIKKEQLALMKSSIKSTMHLLFVGYNAVLPAHPEKIDQNIPLLQTYFPDYHSIYIAESQPEAMIHVLDELIHLDE